MELKDYLDAGAKKAGSLTALGLMLGMSQPTMSNIKAGKRPMPIDAVVKLADYIGADLRALIAANELVTERKEEKRAFWTPFTELGRAAVFLLALLFACVTNFVTPTPANAAPVLKVAPQDFVLCKLLYAIVVRTIATVRAYRTTLLRAAGAFLGAGLSDIAHTA